MGYIMDLRAVVGHRPLIMTCAGVLVLNEYNQLLLQKRADNGLWGYPGGSMELGESFEECAARELRTLCITFIRTGMKFTRQKKFFSAEHMTEFCKGRSPRFLN